MMKLQPNTWQVVLLFVPLIAAELLTSFGYMLHIKNSLLIANVLLCFNVALAQLYQVNFALGFNRNQNKPSKIYAINALIPAIGLSLYALQVFYTSIFRQHNIGSFGPMRIARFNGFAWLIVLLIVYGSINYFFINIKYVSWQIKKNGDVDERERQTQNYLQPMRQLVRVSLWMLGIVLIGGVIVDMLVDLV